MFIKTLLAALAVVAAIWLLRLDNRFTELAGATVLVVLAAWFTVILFRSRNRMVG